MTETVAIVTPCHKAERWIGAAVRSVLAQTYPDWEHWIVSDDGADYEALKERFARRLLEQLDRWVPEVRGKIDYYELSTPLSTRHFANYPEGEIYGLDHTPRRFRQTWLKPRTPIPGLYLAGQDVVSDGIAGALMGGVLTASAVLRRNVLQDLMKPRP